MLKHALLILVLTIYKCRCDMDLSGLEITLDTEFLDEEDNYGKYKIPPENSLPHDYHKYENVEYNLVKTEPITNTVLNDDTFGFLHRLRKVALKVPKKGLGKKPIYRQAITIIANSAEKDHQYGTRKIFANNVPKLYMPVPQAISHILGKEHIPYNVYGNLANSYNY